MSPTASSTAVQWPRSASSRGRRVNAANQKTTNRSKRQKNRSRESSHSRLPIPTIQMLQEIQKPSQSGRLIHSSVVHYAAKRLVKVQRTQVVSIHCAPTPVRHSRNTEHAHSAGTGESGALSGHLLNDLAG